MPCDVNLVIVTSFYIVIKKVFYLIEKVFLFSLYNNPFLKRHLKRAFKSFKKKFKLILLIVQLCICLTKYSILINVD